MARPGIIEAPRTIEGLVHHNKVKDLTWAGVLKSGGMFETKPGAVVVIGVTPDPEKFWLPNRVNGSAADVTTILALDSDRRVQAVTLTDRIRQMVIKPDGIIERIGLQGRNIYEPNSNVVQEWDAEGGLVRLEVVHDLPSHNGEPSRIASATYWSNFDSEGPGLVREAQELFNPANTSALRTINAYLRGMYEVLTPGFELGAGPNQLRVREGFNAGVRWDAASVLKEVWEVAGFRQAFNPRRVE